SRPHSRYSLTPPIYFASPHAPPPHVYTLSLHDALPISSGSSRSARSFGDTRVDRLTMTELRAFFARECSEAYAPLQLRAHASERSEEHTSELQSPDHLVCRLLLEKKKSRWSPTRTTP